MREKSAETGQYSSLFSMYDYSSDEFVPKKRFNKIIRSIWLCACVLSLSIPQLLCEAPCRTTHALNGIALAGHSYRDIPSQSLERCIFACEADPACFSLNFFSRENVCEFNRVSKEWFPEHMVAIQGAVYIESVTREFSFSTSCWSGSCCGKRSTSSERCRCPLGYTGPICEQECVPSSLGMEDGRITNNQISASAYVEGHGPEQGRLRVGLGWRPYNKGFQFHGVWFQVKFAPEVVLFTHVATQASMECFVKAYALAFQPRVFHPWINYTDANGGTLKMFSGNQDVKSVVKREIKEPFKAVSIRILPHQFEGCASMRVELYGCLVS